MKQSLSIFVFLALVVAGCEVKPEKSDESYQPSATPARVQQTPEPVDPAEIAKADTSKQGATLYADEDDGKKSLNCKEYNRVMINGSRNEVSITGVCSQILVNGHGNKVSAVAAAEIVAYGTQNEISYSKFANGNRPTVTDSPGSNTISKVTAAEPAKKK